MSATQHTTNLHLSQFQSTDIPTWMTDYNGDMMRIDNSIGNISELVNPEGSLVDNINAFQDDVDALETLIGSASDLPVPISSVTANIGQINNNLSATNTEVSKKINKSDTVKKTTGDVSGSKEYSIQIPDDMYTNDLQAFLFIARGWLAVNSGDCAYLLTAIGNGYWSAHNLSPETSGTTPTVSISNKTITLKTYNTDKTRYALVKIF